MDGVAYSVVYCSYWLAAFAAFLLLLLCAALHSLQKVSLMTNHKAG